MFSLLRPETPGGGNKWKKSTFSFVLRWICPPLPNLDLFLHSYWFAWHVLLLLPLLHILPPLSHRQLSPWCQCPRWPCDHPPLDEVQADSRPLWRKASDWSTTTFFLQQIDKTDSFKSSSCLISSWFRLRQALPQRRCKTNIRLQECLCHIRTILWQRKMTEKTLGADVYKKKN